MSLPIAFTALNLLFDKGVHRSGDPYLIRLRVSRQMYATAGAASATRIRLLIIVPAINAGRVSKRAVSVHGRGCEPRQYPVAFPHPIAAAVTHP